MTWTDEQTPIDISGTVFPKFVDDKGKETERFWYVKEEFIRHSHNLLNYGGMFSQIAGRLVGDRWVCSGKLVSSSDIADFVWKLRLFYMKSECMSIFSFSTYMEKHVDNIHVNKFFKHMRESWRECLARDVTLFGDNYSGPIKTNKQLIDTLLYSGNFNSQEKYKKRYDKLLEHMDDSLIFMSSYNALHSSYQMTQISRSLNDLREDNLVILLPNHLRHEWDDNCPYKVIR